MGRNRHTTLLKATGNKGNDGGDIQSDIESYLRVKNPGVGLAVLIGGYAVVLGVIPAALVLVFRSGIWN